MLIGIKTSVSIFANTFFVLIFIVLCSFLITILIMKKYLFTGIICVCALTLISWGVIGHRAVAKIAENHLTPKTQEAIKLLLGRQTLPDISTWADEIRSSVPQYKYTGAWHFIDVPSGYDFEQFSTAVKTMKEDNAYKIIIRCVNDLRDPNKSKSDKVIALKFLVHIVGDLHQPMHVSHAEDRGGNNIAVTFDGTSDNLHALWDSGLIEHEGLGYQKMATTYDTATPEEIKKWQSDEVMVWAWESYQISSILYKEAAENPTFEDDYYQSHMPVLQKRIEKGGIRLAGLLNMIFDKQ
jgi:hypothetical protein